MNVFALSADLAKHAVDEMEAHVSAYVNRHELERLERGLEDEFRRRIQEALHG